MMDPNLTRRQDERTGRVSFFFLLFFFVNKNRAHENANEIRIHSKGKARQKWRHGHFRSRFRRTRIVGVRLCVCVRVCVCVCVWTRISHFGRAGSSDALVGRAFHGALLNAVGHGRPWRPRRPPTKRSAAAVIFSVGH